MKCKQCNTEYEPKRSTSKYCSAACRKLAFQSDGKVSVPPLSVPDGSTVIGPLRELHAGIARNAPKSTPEVGSGWPNPNRTAVEPEQTKPEQRTRTGSDWDTEKGQEIVGDILNQLDKIKPARSHPVPIPGDPDYEGCCHKVDGVWVVDNTKPSISTMSTDELIRRLYYITGWKQSPEHKEVMRRRAVA